jgi:hypothetical protein
VEKKRSDVRGGNGPICHVLCLALKSGQYAIHSRHSSVLKASYLASVLARVRSVGFSVPGVGVGKDQIRQIQ